MFQTSNKKIYKPQLSCSRRIEKSSNQKSHFWHVSKLSLSSFDGLHLHDKYLFYECIFVWIIYWVRKFFFLSTFYIQYPFNFFSFSRVKHRLLDYREVDETQQTTDFKQKDLEHGEEHEGGYASTSDEHRRHGDSVIRVITTTGCPCQPIELSPEYLQSTAVSEGVMRLHNVGFAKNTDSLSLHIDCEEAPPLIGPNNHMILLLHSPVKK